MKIALLSAEGDGIALAARFAAEGHDVTAWIKDRKADMRWQGLTRRTFSATGAIGVRCDLVVCDANGLVPEATAARKRGVPVFGGQPVAERLERDRMFGLRVARECGIRVPATHEFKTVADVRRFLVSSREGPFVLKCEGNVDTHTTFVGDRNDDTLAFLENVDLTGAKGFVLQEKIDARLELNTEVWFADGVPLPFPNGGMEQKKWLAGDMGWNTGCESYIVWPYEEERPRAVRACFPDPLLAWLRRERYSGPLDVATLLSADDDELWMTEFTPRFGYSSIYAMLALLPVGFDFGAFLHAIAVGNQPTLEYRGGIATAITVSTPPYPYPIPKMTVRGQRMDDAGIPPRHWWPIDVMADPRRGRVTAGTSGLLGYVTDHAYTLDEAVTVATARAWALKGANAAIQFRTDALAQREGLWLLDLLGYVDRARWEAPSFDLVPGVIVSDATDDGPVAAVEAVTGDDDADESRLAQATAPLPQTFHATSSGP